MPPEYAVDGLFSLKSDVYSFGVLVLEIVSGQRNRGFHHKDNHHNLVGHVSLHFRKYYYVPIVHFKLRFNILVQKEKGNNKNYSNI